MPYILITNGVTGSGKSKLITETQAGLSSIEDSHHLKKEVVQLEKMV